MLNGYCSSYILPSSWVLTWKERANGFQTAIFALPGLRNLHLEKNCLLVEHKAENILFNNYTHIRRWMARIHRTIQKRSSWSHTQGQRRSSSKTVGGANSHLESNPIPARDTQRAQTNLVHKRTQGTHRDWDRTVFERLLWRYGLAVDCRRDRGAGFSRLGYGISPLGGGHHYPHRRAAPTYTGLRNRLLEGTNRTTYAPGPRRKEQWPHKRLTQTCPGVSRSLQQKRGSVVACCRAGGNECGSTRMGPFERSHHYLHYLHQSLASGKQQLHPSTENWIKDLLSMARHIRTRPSIPLSHSIP